MSRIYFHSEHGEAEVHGPERRMAGAICTDMLLSVLRIRRADPSHLARLATLFPDDHYVRQRPTESSIETAVAVGSDFFEPALNTALVMGSDAIKLAARLHGQCELHAYVEGEDRAWLADIIERGRESGIFREKMGWESVVELLRTRNDCPVVTSYSVCDSFPNQSVAGVPYDEENPNAFYDLPTEERWRLSLAGLRAKRGLRLQPTDWQDFYFHDGETGFDLLAKIAAVESRR